MRAFEGGEKESPGQPKPGGGLVFAMVAADDAPVVSSRLPEPRPPPTPGAMAPFLQFVTLRVFCLRPEWERSVTCIDPKHFLGGRQGVIAPEPAG